MVEVGVEGTSPITSADNTERIHDDAPLRILVAFDGNKSKLTLKEKMTFEMANLISGQELPYATLHVYLVRQVPSEHSVR